MKRFIWITTGLAIGVASCIGVSYVRHLSNYPTNGGYWTFSEAPDDSDTFANFGVIKNRDWWTGEETFEYVAALQQGDRVLDEARHRVSAMPHPSLRTGANGPVGFEWRHTESGVRVTVTSLDWQVELGGPAS